MHSLFKITLPLVIFILLPSLALSYSFAGDQSNDDKSSYINAISSNSTILIGPADVNNNPDRHVSPKKEWTIIDYVLPPWLIRGIDGIMNFSD